jgi:hypothetical protein
MLDFFQKKPFVQIERTKLLSLSSFIQPIQLYPAYPALSSLSSFIQPIQPIWLYPAYPSNYQIIKLTNYQISPSSSSPY